MHLPDAIERIRPSVIQIGARDGLGKHSIVGTGFICTERVTAHRQARCSRGR